MSNPENLEGYRFGDDKRSASEQREIQRKGGINSGKARRTKRNAKVLLNQMLSAEIKEKNSAAAIKNIFDIDNDDITYQAMVLAALIKKAGTGNTQAIELLFRLSEDHPEVKQKNTELKLRKKEFEDKRKALLAAEQDEDRESGFSSYAGLPADILGKAYTDVYRDIRARGHRFYDFKGGRGSLKSTFCAEALIDEIERNREFCGIAIRQVKDTLKDSVYAQIVWAIAALGLEADYKCTVSPLEIKKISTGQKIYFRGADDPLKLKSIRPPKDMYIGVAWIEEADQLHGKAALRSILQSVMRGGDDTIVLRSYNTPMSRNHFINLEALEDRPDRLVHHSYYYDAPKEWLGEPFFLEAEYLKQTNEKAYRHEYLGEAVGTGGSVFENVNVREITEEELNGFERVYMGVDWGYYPDPFAWVKAAYDPARRRLFLIDELVVHKQSNQSTAQTLREQKGVTPGDTIFADSAEPKSIADYRAEGFSCYGAKKGKGSLDYSMKWLQGLSEIVIDISNCPKAAEEFTAYEYEQTKEGEIISGYPDKDNHCIDAVRYGLYPVWKQSGE